MPYDAISTTAQRQGEPDALDELDRQLRGRFARRAGGQSPWSIMEAVGDWWLHLATSPGRQAALAQQALAAAAALSMQGPVSSPQKDWAFKPKSGDRRFSETGWQAFPFAHLAQTQLAIEAQWEAAAQVRGEDPRHARRLAFMGKFVLNALAPVNFPWTNPEVVAASWRMGGRNFLDGAKLYAEDLTHLLKGETLEGLDAFKPGLNIAITPGKVVFRNEVMELIQFEPATSAVRRQPILIAPAWIMKYYILDLTPPESLVRYLVEAGFTVFIISWKNPGQAEFSLSLEEYRNRGVVAALDVVQAIVPGEKVHAVGYCLGGTMLAITAAAFDRDGRDRLASLTLLAAQTDFGEAGELMLFIDSSQLALLEDMMHVQGYLDARQMSAAFYALRAHEMVFSKFVERYFLNRPRAPSGLDAWLADPTRMPARTHGEYLRKLFLENQLAHGSYQVDGRSVALNDIKTPIFALGAEWDHIAPWRSVFMVELYSSADTTFVLTGGGHNSSVVSPPGKPGAYYWVGGSTAGGSHVDLDDWLARTPRHDGSWWPEWLAWLERQSSPDLVPPPPMGAPANGLSPICDAPGVYVAFT